MQIRSSCICSARESKLVLIEQIIYHRQTYFKGDAPQLLDVRLARNISFRHAA